MNRVLLILVFLAAGVLTSEAQFRRSRDKQPAQAAGVDESVVNYANPAEYIIAGIDVKGLNVLDKTLRNV